MITVLAILALSQTNPLPTPEFAATIVNRVRSYGVAAYPEHFARDLRSDAELPGFFGSDSIHLHLKGSPSQVLSFSVLQGALTFPPPPVPTPLPDTELESIARRVASEFTPDGWEVTEIRRGERRDPYRRGYSVRRSPKGLPDVIGGRFGMSFVVLDPGTGAVLTYQMEYLPRVEPALAQPRVSFTQARAAAAATVSQRWGHLPMEEIGARWIYAVPQLRSFVNAMTPAHDQLVAEDRGLVMLAYSLTAGRYAVLLFVDGTTGKVLAEMSYPNVTIGVPAAAKAKPALRDPKNLRWRVADSDSEQEGRLAPATVQGAPQGDVVALQSGSLLLRAQFDAGSGVLWLEGRAYTPDANLKKAMQRREVPGELPPVRPVGI